MKRSRLAIGLIVFLAAVLAAGTTFAQTTKDTTKCSVKVDKQENGQVQYVLTGPDCEAAAKKINKQQEQEGKALGGRNCKGKCVCTLESGADIWICRGCCTPRMLDW